MGRTGVASYLRRVPPLPPVLRNLGRFDAPVFKNFAGDDAQFDLAQAVDAPEPELSPQIERRLEEAVAYRCRLIQQADPAAAADKRRARRRARRYDVDDLLQKVRDLSLERRTR